jgi:glutathione synthase/RimK-type ligase-like ATP-grasp enzyme
MKKFIILRTDKGGRYARKVMRSIHWINEHQYPNEIFNTIDFTISQFMNYPVQFRDVFHAQSTVIHSRCANPRTAWTEKLRTLEEGGFKVVNSVDAIELTSNKLACALHLQNIVPHPLSWEYSKDMSPIEFTTLLEEIDRSEIDTDFLIAKPLTSLSQGAHVRKFHWEGDETLAQIRAEFDKVPGDRIVIQEYFPYTAMHRVIVIGGRALPYTFVDRVAWHPENWKVSCCLNRTSMRIDQNPSPHVLNIAERTQQAVNGEINFIDIFEDEVNLRFSISEINTACSLNIHEKLAKDAGRRDWNIHYRIAKHLVKKMMGE